MMDWKWLLPAIMSMFLIGEVAHQTNVSGQHLGSSPGNREWLTGRKLDVRLKSKMGATWSNVSLRSAVVSLSRTQRVAVFLDRRLNPDQLIDLSVVEDSLFNLFQRIAQQVGGDLSRLGDILYLGPAKSSRVLRTTAQIAASSASKLSPRMAKTWRAKAPWEWPFLSTPREILRQLATENRFTYDNLDAIPHDLWDAETFPPLSLVNRITLAVIGFDLTFSVKKDPYIVRFIPIPQDIALERRYKTSRPLGQLIRDFSEIMPEAKVSTTQGEVVVRGLLEEHERFKELLTGSVQTRRTGNAPTLKTRMRIRVELRDKPVGEVMQDFAHRSGYTLEIDSRAIEQAGLSLETLISLSLSVTMSPQELFQAIAKPAGMGVSIHGKTITLVPSGKSAPEKSESK